MGSLISLHFESLCINSHRLRSPCHGSSGSLWPAMSVPRVKLLTQFFSPFAKPSVTSVHTLLPLSLRVFPPTATFHPFQLVLYLSSPQLNYFLTSYLFFSPEKFVYIPTVLLHCIQNHHCKQNYSKMDSEKPSISDELTDISVTQSHSHAMKIYSLATMLQALPCIHQ